ncbi:MAG TPA: sigma factor, partial [Pseudonocardia sp.]|nr:sigma factor [Pseudonocardia sp.]
MRDEGRRVLATLARVTGDLPLAEDAVQDAAVRALESWPR